MVFSSLEFLFFFLPLVLFVYFLIKTKYANLWLMVASLVFYYIGDKEHIRLLLMIILLSYFSGLAMQKCKKHFLKKVLMIETIGIMVMSMSYYKYWNFMITNINLIFEKNYGLKNILFPIGISFYVFQAISYIADVYKGEKALQNPIDMALYISFFPQLIAGPIVRFHDIREYMGKEHREISIINIENGIWRFCIGLSKKVLLANNLGGLADIVFGVHDISQFSVMYTWLGAIAYTLQIYFDFSGYSDMAIGLGQVFGFKFQENFNYPYLAESVRDFWRRWHISLSQFFRDYVYIPIGGNQCSKIRWVVNILFVWFLTGLWHGASWNYILWGMLYGFILIIERFAKPLKGKNSILIKVLKHTYTMVLVILLWVIFRTDNLRQAMKYLFNMFGIGAKSFIDQGFIFQAKNYFVLLAASFLFCFPIVNMSGKNVTENRIIDLMKAIGLICCTVSSISYIYMGSYNPFLYFMF